MVTFGILLTAGVLVNTASGSVVSANDGNNYLSPALEQMKHEVTHHNQIKHGDDMTDKFDTRKIMLLRQNKVMATPANFGTNSKYTRVRTKQERRALGEDMNLPVPVSVHELGQHTLRTHEFERILDPEIPAKSGTAPPEMTPLYPGYGTHFSYVYVGTPAQRQSVIIDTGSHYTAFPCVGCSQCGSHTDQYWDIKNSSTAFVPKCAGTPCLISQSYSEGSSWKAMKVLDKLWVGGLYPTTVTKAMTYTIDFMFGCQTSETGLFRTQLADGIMGMSMADDTLPRQLAKQGVTKTTAFALCFRVGGGIMTLGGVDQTIHSRPGIQYVKMKEMNNWFQVNLLDISLIDQKNPNLVGGSNAKSMLFPAKKYSEGKGCIVDSGTTDTYLPSALLEQFSTAFKEISGIKWNSGNIALTAEELAKIPNIVFTFEGIDGEPLKIVMPWTNYVDSVGGGKYAFRIYLTEGSGTILGANFMVGMNVIFDEEGKQVGFAKSSCKYEEFEEVRTFPPSAAPVLATDGDDKEPKIVRTCPELIPITECSAVCETQTEGYYSPGIQKFKDGCGTTLENDGAVACKVPCVGMKIVRGDPQCPDRPWTECDKSCMQSRMRMVKREGAENVPMVAGDKCVQTKDTRNCYNSLCPAKDGDYLIFIDLRVLIAPSRWSYVFSEAFYGALSLMFQIKESAIELLNDAGNEYSKGVKLHFSLRIKAKDYNSLQALHAAAQAIPEAVYHPEFEANLIAALDTVSKKNDGINYSRFGYLVSGSIEVLNAMAMPYGDIRDPIEMHPGSESPSAPSNAQNKSAVDLFLFGVAISCLTVLSCVLIMHMRLRQEHAALEKDKISGGSLRKMWNKFTKMGGGDEKYFKVELTGEGDDVSSPFMAARTNVPFSSGGGADDELDREDRDNN